MAKLAKFLQGVAGAAGGAGLNVEDVFSTYLYDVFSTYLYDGTGSAQTITNGIDLDGEGGMVWIKERSTSGSDHGIHDTERGVKNPIFTNLTDAENSYYNTNNQGITAFNSDGFTVASGSNFNDNGDTAASWTFRKAPKFFTCLTYSGTGTAQTISHDLGVTPGCVIIKSTTNAEDWVVYHRSLGGTYYGKLNATDQFLGPNTTVFNGTDPTDSVFSVGTNSKSNGSGQTYVAYLFAHNDGDGEFGPDGDADIIKCGSYTGNGSSTGPEIDLGFEPQWVLLKASHPTEGTNWIIVDSMRGIPTGSNDYWLTPNTSSSESPVGTMSLTATGFKIDNAGLQVNANGVTHIYIAIRRGPMAVPESATDVFDVDAYSGNSSARTITTNFPVDLSIIQNRTGTGDNNAVADRLRGKNVILGTNTASYELTNNSNKITAFDNMSGVEIGTDTSVNWSSSTYAAWNFRRAPNYFDVVAYTGNGTAGRTVSHNLGVEPEMIWFKKRSSTQNWYVYHKDNTYISGALNSYLRLNTTDANLNSSYFMSSISSSNFGLTIGSPNDSGATYIAYLFASLDGVSKVGSYTGNGSSQTIDCGFSSGARFVLIKPSSTTGGWRVFDTERGIVSGNDPYLVLQSTNAEDSSYDIIDPDSSGFAVVQDASAPVNASGVTYIFYAIA